MRKNAAGGGGGRGGGGRIKKEKGAHFTVLGFRWVFIPFLIAVVCQTAHSSISKLNCFNFRFDYF